MLAPSNSDRSHHALDADLDVAAHPSRRVGRVSRLASAQLDPQFHPQAVHVGDLVLAGDPLPDRGQKVSIALGKENTPDAMSRRWMSRAVMSCCWPWTNFFDR